MNADVLLLAAGFGRRLRPLTESIPKPLVEVAGKTLLDWNLELIAKAGFRKVFINLHYLPDKIVSHLERNGSYGLEVQFVEEKKILDTGGAIKNIERFLEHQTLLTVNSDILLGPDFDLNALLASHAGRQVTMSLRTDSDSKAYGEIAIDSDQRVCEFLGVSYLPELTVTERMMYLGVQAISTEVLQHMPESGSAFSITQDTYVSLLEQDVPIYGYVYEGYWSDVGTHERLELAREKFPQ